MVVSVIVPTFNRSNLINRAIKSIMNQTYPHIEIIIVDDGSTDNTLEVIEALIQHSVSPIRYHKKSNGGCASARNRGLELATGELIAFLDSDDLWLPMAVETMVSELTASGADFVYSPVIEAYKDSSEVVNYPVAAGQPEVLAIEHFKVTNVRNGSLLFRKGVFSAIGRFDESLKYNEDSDFIQRVAIHCKAAYSPVPSVKVFHHRGKKSKNRVEIYKALLKSVKKVLSENPEFASSLGKIAGNRISEIKSHLTRALIMNGNFTEAINVAMTIKKPLGIDMQLALLFKTTVPLNIKSLFSRAKKILGDCPRTGIKF